VAVSLTVLDTISIATHCTVPWNEMQGDDYTRFCSKCSKNVHNISAMTVVEAIKLLNAQNESPCIRFYRRPDGRVVTSECPLTLKERTWKWLNRRNTWAAWLFGLVFLSGWGGSRCEGQYLKGAKGKLVFPSQLSPRLEVAPMPRERAPVAPMPHEATKASSRTTSEETIPSEK
jgi:hypothetical protein